MNILARAPRIWSLIWWTLAVISSVASFSLPSSRRPSSAIGLRRIFRSKPLSVAVSTPPETIPSLHSDSQSPLSLEFEELAEVLEGTGRAKVVWDLLRQGKDPLSSDIDLLGGKALQRYRQHFGPIRDTVAQISKIQTANDGTTKLLLQLLKDGLEVETVIIPWEDRQSSTLCISSQVGCRQGCTFCMTGRMGRLRLLSADEIVAQVFYAIQYIQDRNTEEDIGVTSRLFPIDNIVFMGMGEPADNMSQVTRVARILTDSNQFQLAPRRVTISTVAPSPESFLDLGEAPAALAWSVHASQDELRRNLVPTTKHSMVELRQGLIEALQKRSRRMQSIMMEITLLDGINDSVEAAHHLADFCAPISQQLPSAKVVINVIPWNDISATSGPAAEYRKPSRERVLQFQETLTNLGMRCYIRTTRGDDESAACGQLATKRKTKA